MLRWFASCVRSWSCSEVRFVLLDSPAVDSVVCHASTARVAGGGGAASEETYDPTIPATQQKVTYMAKDGTVKTVTKAELQEQLETSEKLMQSLNETWEEKLVKTQAVQKERETALEELGITVEKNHVGVHTPKKMPHLVNLVSGPNLTTVSMLTLPSMFRMKVIQRFNVP